MALSFARIDLAQCPRRAPPPAIFDEVELLQTEHRNFHRLLRILERELAVFHEGNTPDYELMRDVMHYLIQYTDRFHHPKEDLILEHLLKHQPLVGAMTRLVLREHEELPARATELLAALEQVSGGAMISRDSLESMSRTYLDRMRTHMDREESTLFPLARKHLVGSDPLRVRPRAERSTRAAHCRSRA